MGLRLTAILATIIGLSCVAQAHRVTLVIQNDKVPVHVTKDLDIVPSKQKGGKTFHAHTAVLNDQDRRYDLDDYGKWKVSPKATELIIELAGEEGRVELPLPKEIRDRLLSLFKEAPTKTACTDSFDCACFVAAAHGRHLENVIWRSDSGTVYTKMHLEEYWQIENIDRNNLKPGDLSPGNVIRLFENKEDGNEDQHYALYIGSALYISKFGAGGIYVTDLKGFNAVYPYSHLEIWRPSTAPQCESAHQSTRSALRVCAITMCALFWFLSGP